eukprot:TRINITY_DN16601_c0_g1_i4.p1 TRINITY_DN16601_c0_g1~~TRINITY_DN16601_c0_g1_i4.p1  ORF type:complete len:131 (+),score=8.72 TRINITY_DN16601_c0_g1_i4:3-395(+)
MQRGSHPQSCTSASRTTCRRHVLPLDATHTTTEKYLFGSASYHRLSAVCQQDAHVAIIASASASNLGMEGQQQQQQRLPLLSYIIPPPHERRHCCVRLVARRMLAPGELERWSLAFADLCLRVVLDVIGC